MMNDKYPKVTNAIPLQGFLGLQSIHGMLELEIQVLLLELDFDSNLG